MLISKCIIPNAGIQFCDDYYILDLSEIRDASSPARYGITLGPIHTTVQSRRAAGRVASTNLLLRDLAHTSLLLRVQAKIYKCVP